MNTKGLSHRESLPALFNWAGEGSFSPVDALVPPKSAPMNKFLAPKTARLVETASVADNVCFGCTFRTTAAGLLTNS